MKSKQHKMKSKKFFLPRNAHGNIIRGRLLLWFLWDQVNCVWYKGGLTVGEPLLYMT